MRTKYREMKLNVVLREYKPFVLRLYGLFLLMMVGINGVWGQTEITSLSQITDDNDYIITQDITGGTPGVSTFNGTLEAAINPATHMPYRIKNLSAPLFTTLTGTVKNLVLENVSISGSGNIGAIACEANGNARIYNVGILSGSVSGGNYVGGLIGLLDGSARVINCYSYADITGGSEKAGIVGHNNYASKYNDLRTMVMNCMFYGDIATGGTVVPIYGGEEISNDYNNSTSNRLNNYNYFLYEAPFSKNNTTTNQIITKYNCALAAEERFLVRFEFYRHLLNSTRELAAWYATSTATQSGMLKWVLDKNTASYPILKEQGKYPSIVNYDPSAAPKTPEAVKTLTVNLTGTGITTTSLSIPITDKDPANYNYNYHKVQLPYFNDVGTGNYTNNQVVTGWKIVAIDAVAGDPYSSSNYTGANYDTPNYNFADRGSSNKDLYSVSKRVFSQGGYFNVPEGVSSITIEPYWGKAVYLSDACYDRYGYKNDDDLTQVGGGQRYTDGNTYSINGSDQIVYTTAANALAALTGINNPTVYDYAVVLVGNYHHHADLGRNGPELSDGTKPFTIMSIDLNRDNEPDYCLIYRSGKNKSISPIRFDFITVPGMVMAHKMATHGDLGIPGNCTPKGWFEITTTGLIKYGQFEHSVNNKTLAPVIFMGGVIDQFVANNTGKTEAFNNKTQYMLFGDNVWFKMLSNGNHMDKSQPMPHRPISLIGGEYESLYLSGNFRPDATPCTTGNGDRNAECYIDGGKFGEVAGAGQEQIDGNVTWLIDHADIENFYGGGINSEKPITGDITTTIRNSKVGVFCGGPKFGNMATDKTVTTSAIKCVFGTYFGAGYGGTSIYREQFYNKYQSLNYNEWNTQLNNNYREGTRGYKTNKGIPIDYEYEFFGGSDGNVHRMYIHYANFSLAQTNDVSSSLEDCTVLQNFYGGGSLGAVAGDATSTLTDCTIHGSAFGAGFSASIPSVSVRNLGGFNPEPLYNTATGVYEAGGYPETVTYKWAYVASLNNGSNALEDDGSSKTIKTTVNLSALGTVSGNATLNIRGNTIVEGKVYQVDEDGELVLDNFGNAIVKEQTGGAFGGGDMSAALGDTEVNVEGGTSAEIYNVFGGGNKADVAGNVTVNLISGTVKHDVYGGGALANTNTGNTSNTTIVNLTGGTIEGDAYGGGLGRLASGTEGNNDYLAPVAALVNGNVTVTLNGTAFVINTTTDDENNPVPASGRIFGCNNINGSPKGTVLVMVKKTVPANGATRAKGTFEVQAVYGGGNLAPYDPTDPAADGQYTVDGHSATDKPVQVVIDGCDAASIEYVYGGGNAAPVPATDVLILGSFEIDKVFGGGNGKDKYILDGGTTWIANNGADVGIKNATHDAQGMATGGDQYGTGEALTTILGGTINAIYGGSNIKGDVISKAEVVMGDENLDYCDFKIGEVYGGGNEAYLSGTAGVTMKCIEGIDEIYGGSKNADVGNDVILNITGGHYNRVFGGNNIGGIIHGTITVNIEEKGCLPITIEELYGGGNQAPYSVENIRADRKTSLGENYINYPQVNIISATNIGTVYGGGLGERASVTGNPHVNINMEKGKIDGRYHYVSGISPAAYSGYGVAQDLPLGKIGTVFGGGNAAQVNGNTYVNIGDATFVDEDCVEVPITRNNAIITGNVYGGGNQANVTGKTNVVVGQ